MNSSLGGFLLSVTLLAATGCASSAFGEGLLSESEVDERPRYVFCPGDRQRFFLPPNEGDGVLVSVPIVIGVDGTVIDVGSPRSRLYTSGRRSDPQSTAFHGDALQQARGCLYEPAQLDGRPVPASSSVTFWFPRLT